MSRQSAIGAGRERALTFMSIGLGVLILVVLIGVLADAKVVEANRWVTHSYEVRAIVDRFVDQVARGESSARGYAFTGEPLFKERVPIHESEATRILGQLEQAVSDNPAQVARAARLRTLLGDKAVQDHTLMELRDTAGMQRASEYLRGLLAEPGQPTSDLVRTADAMHREEDRLLTLRREAQTEQERTTRCLEGFGGLIALGLFMWALVITRRASEARNAAETQFRQAFEDAGVGMALVELDGRWRRVNEAVCRMLGYSRDELQRKTFQEVTHPDDLATDLGNVQALLAGREKTYRMEKRYRHRDGRYVWGNLTVSLVRTRDGHPSHFISQIEDITARKQMEEQLRSARDDALDLARSKADFLATMSHEIRTPMNGVIGMAQLLASAPLQPEQRAMVEVIRMSGEGLIRVINDILDFSKLEAGKMAIREGWFNLGALIDSTLALFAAQAREKGLVLAYKRGEGTDGEFLGDSGRVGQILTNLVGNALRFTEAGTVTVLSSALVREGGPQTLRIEVSDTGVGIPQEAQGRLFERFSQAKGQDSVKYGGTGLGLAISDRLAKLMGGSIGFASTPNVGSRFWCELPMRRRDAVVEDHAGDPVAQALPRLRGRILLVEDNKINQAVARAMLAQIGLEVVLAENGKEALDHLAKEPCDAVLMDCQMPIMDGYEATRKIREGGQGGDPGILVIGLTAYALAGDRAKCLAAGMDDFLTKPLQMAELHAMLRRRFESNEKNRSPRC